MTATKRAHPLPRKKVVAWEWVEGYGWWMELECGHHAGRPCNMLVSQKVKPTSCPCTSCQGE